MSEPEVYMSNRDLILEIRADVKAIEQKLEAINVEGSIGTRAELADHETRIRSAEKWRYGISGTFLLALFNTVTIWLFGSSSDGL